MRNLFKILVILVIIYSGILWAEDTQPKGLKAVAGDRVIYIHWSSPQRGANGYLVYRALPDGEYERLTPHPLQKPFYEDRNVVNGQFYWYTLTAIDREGNEGAPSKEVWAKPTPHHGPLTGY